MTCSTTNGAVTTTNQSQSQTNFGIGTAALLNSPLLIIDGGNGVTTSNGVPIGNGTSTFQYSAPGSATSQLFIAATSGPPIFANATSALSSMTFTGGTGTYTVQAVQATSSSPGPSAFSTNAQAVTGTSTSVVVTPAAYKAALAAPQPIGSTTPAQGTFTTVTLTTTSGPQINSGSGAPSASIPQGSMYMRTDGTTTNNRAYITTNALGTYTAFVTVA